MPPTKQGGKEEDKVLLLYGLYRSRRLKVLPFRKGTSTREYRSGPRGWPLAKRMRVGKFEDTFFMQEVVKGKKSLLNSPYKFYPITSRFDQICKNI